MTSHVNVDLKTSILEVSPVSIIRVDPNEDRGCLQNGGFNSILTRLIAHEGYSTFIHRENFKSYIIK